VAHATAAAVPAKHAAPVAKPGASHSTSHTTTKHSTTVHKAATHKAATHKVSSHKRASTHKTSSHKRVTSHKSTSHKSTSHKSTSHKRSTTHKRSTSHKSTTHKSTSHKRTRNNSSRSANTSANSSGPGRHPEQRSVLTVKTIKQLWVGGCAKAGTGGSYKPYCRCTYAHLSKAGALRTRKRLHHLMRELKAYERTHDIAKLPAYVRSAIISCAGKLPPLEPMGSNPAVNQLPNSSYPSAPVSAPTSPSGTSSTPAPAPSTTAPAPTGTNPTGTTPTQPSGTTPTGTTPTGTTPTGTTPTGATSTQSTGGTAPPWASLVRELDRTAAAIATH
jgi:hypothetical protein